MIVGPVGAGKTSLMNALNRNCLKAEKTQSICFTGGMIDTPGEYAQIPRFYSALMVTATQAKLVIMVQDSTDFSKPLPPGFAGMFPRPVTGVITKIDIAGSDNSKAQNCLKQAGVKEPYFSVSAQSGAGIAELTNYLMERGCK
ncbi:EutP/PduV family microcompartment system protein [Sporomusa acidovorans]|nr:EutP/PduV family microcompartment system protein [Sporomusa acidovorans]